MYLHPRIRLQLLPFGILSGPLLLFLLRRVFLPVQFTKPNFMNTNRHFGLQEEPELPHCGEELVCVETPQKICSPYKTVLWTWRRISLVCIC